MKKYTVFVQKITGRHRSGRYYSNHGVAYKATFKDKEKALKTAKSWIGVNSVNYIVVKELDTENREYGTGGRQLSSGIYYTQPYSYATYSDKKILLELGTEYGNSPIGGMR